MSNDFHNLVNKNSSAGIRILPTIETIKRLVTQLDSQTDLLIALTHQGVVDDSILAMNVQGLDLIVGGHSHTRLTHPKKVNGVLIVQAGLNCENLGVLDLSVENDLITQYDGGLIQLWYNSARPKKEIIHFHRLY